MLEMLVIYCIKYEVALIFSLKIFGKSFTLLLSRTISGNYWCKKIPKWQKKKTANGCEVKHTLLLKPSQSSN